MKRVFMILALVMLISSCTHKEHSFSKEWIYDDVSHMRVCTSADCNETIAYAEHSFITVEEMKYATSAAIRFPTPQLRQSIRTPLPTNIRPVQLSIGENASRAVKESISASTYSEIQPLQYRLPRTRREMVRNTARYAVNPLT